MKEEAMTARIYKYLCNIRLMSINYTVKLLLIVFAVLFTFLNTYIKASALTVDISASTADSVGVGRSFDVSLSVTTASYGSIGALQFAVSYDKNYLTFKDASCAAEGEVDFYDNEGIIHVVALFTSGISSPDDFLTLSFTAKSGNEASTQTIMFSYIDGATVSFDDLSATVTSAVTIEVTRSSSGSSGTSGSSASSKSSASSSSKSSSSARSGSSATGGAIDSGENYFGYDDTFSAMDENENETSLSSATSGFFTTLSTDDGKIKYVLVGAVIALSVAAIAAVIYRLGKIKGAESAETSMKTERNNQANKESPEGVSERILEEELGNSQLAELAGWEFRPQMKSAYDDTAEAAVADSESIIDE